MELSLQRTYTREEIVPAALSIVETMLERESSKEALSKVYIGGQILSEVEKRLKARALSALDGKKEIVSGVELSTRNLPVQWDYTMCNDDTLDTLTKNVEEAEFALSEAKAKLEERQKWLQLLKEPVADTTTGAVINPPEKLSAGETLMVRFPK